MLMLYSLTLSELNLLAKYRFTDKLFEGIPFISFQDLLDHAKILTHLDQIGKQIGSPTHKVTASLMAKRMAFYAVIHLYAMSALNKKFEVDLKEVKLIERNGDSLWLPDFYLGDFIISDPGENRDKWRQEVVKDVFSCFFHTLLEMLRLTTRFSKLVMWENIAVYVFWLYESILKNEENPERKLRMEDDYQFVMHHAQGSLFGPYQHNPLSRFDSEKVFREEYEEKIRVRKTCCLSNLLDAKEGKRCSTCPNGCNMPPFKTAH
jgi:ferric iron reductase protein FhuF